MKTLVQNGILISMALVLSIAEKWFPVSALVPLPGIKLGLANVITMFALFYFGLRSAITVTVLRCILGSIFYGGLLSLVLSLSGAGLALITMVILKFGYGKMFSLTGISIGGAAAHNIGQVAMAAVLMGNSYVFAYLTILLTTAVVTGFLTGTAAEGLLTKLEKIGIIELRAKGIGEWSHVN